MSDQKYRQRGYQDTGGRPEKREGDRPQKPKEPYDPRIPRDPKTPNMMGFQQVFRCARCGSLESAEIGSLSTCSKCGVDLHACLHCASFDSSATFECMQAIPARVTPKDTRNTCTFFQPRTRIEKQTTSTGSVSPSGPSAARKAFDDLFK
jgi:hypothetical protein